ncbi:MAG: hypothetical protein IT233_05675 [Bacteroidia bacterium]|nr:hypothetical protein [Bacteroidia bacterium]
MKAFLRKAYAILPGKKIVFTLLRDLFYPDQKVYCHLHFHGVFWVEMPGEEISFRMRHFGYVLENQLFWESWDRFSESGSLSSQRKGTGTHARAL